MKLPIKGKSSSCTMSDTMFPICWHWHAFMCIDFTSMVRMLSLSVKPVRQDLGCLASEPVCDNICAFASAAEAHCSPHCCRNGNIMIREPPQGSLSLEELRKKIIELLFKHLVSPSVAVVKKSPLRSLGQYQQLVDSHSGQLPGLLAVATWKPCARLCWPLVPQAVPSTVMRSMQCAYHTEVHLSCCHIAVAAWPSSCHRQALHSWCPSLAWASLLQTLPGNNAITEMAHSALEPVASDNKLPKALLSASLKPILVHLAYHNKLKLPLLKGLGRLLQLLSSWFNLALGGHGC